MIFAKQTLLDAIIEYQDATVQTRRAKEAVLNAVCEFEYKTKQYEDAIGKSSVNTLMRIEKNKEEANIELMKAQNALNEALKHETATRKAHDNALAIVDELETSS
jgi:hypothetical protein